MNELTRRDCLRLTALAGAFLPWQLALAGDAADLLRNFVREVRSGRADFSQTVTSPDGSKKKVSSGRFEFQRPQRFRFTYLKPYPQTIVCDGEKVWFHDPDLNQVTVRKLSEALGSTPVALLAGQHLERDFELKALPERDGLVWVQATPRNKEGTIQWMKAGFKGTVLAAVEIADSFGQHSLLSLSGLQTEVSLPADTFKFVVPPGADVAQS